MASPQTVRIIGQIFREWVGSQIEPYFHAGNGTLAARIIARVELGVLEGRGNLSQSPSSTSSYSPLPKQAGKSLRG